MSTTTEITLTQVVEVDGVTYDSLVLRPATREDVNAIRRLNAGRYLRGVKFAARLADLPPRTLEKIIADDDAAIEAVRVFAHQQIDLVNHG